MDKVEVLVIGGGPAGTTAASTLAQRGRSVVLLEQDAHPRFHIGESLLPCNLPILDRLGVLDAVRDIGVHKPGADFTVGDRTIQAFEFARALGTSPGHAYQVKRADFDALLFANCRRLGVDAREEHTVTNVTQGADGFTVSYVRHGEPGIIDARFLVDASGRNTLLANSNGWRERNRRHASAAMFGHFEGVTPRTGQLAGNISVYWFEHGWLWFIPLTGGIMSVGAVCSPELFRTRASDLTTFLRDTIAQVPGADERFADARPIIPVSATGNYSYRSKRLWGPGFLLVGDAYAFVDPVFSSGVFLAMSGAERSADAVEAWLDNDIRGFRAECRRLQRSVDRNIGAFEWFIYRFTSPVMRELFRAPRNDWQVEQAVISMLAGDGGGSQRIRFRLALFKLIYAISGLTQAGPLWAWHRRRRADSTFNDETLMT